MKKVNAVLFSLHLIVGIGAMVGGLAGILNPLNPLGTSIYLLKNSPFTDFFIPCLILFFILGFGNVVSAVSFILKSKYKGYISSLLGLALVIWIIVQCIMLRTIIALHVIFFVIGVVQVSLASILMLKENLFPANIVNNFYNSKVKR